MFFTVCSVRVLGESEYIREFLDDHELKVSEDILHKYKILLPKERL